MTCSLTLLKRLVYPWKLFQITVNNSLLKNNMIHVRMDPLIDDIPTKLAMKNIKPLLF